MNPELKLEGKIAIVTGGARDIGREVSKNWPGRSQSGC